MEILKLNETRFEDAEGDEKGLQEAQDQDRELQKMKMDFEDSEAIIGRNDQSNDNIAN